MFILNKSRMLLLPFLVILCYFNNVEAQSKSMGEPVPGAEVYIELEPDDEPIANVTTNENGEFSFVITKTIPNSGTFIMTIKVTKKLALHYNIDLRNNPKIKIPFNKAKDGSEFEYILHFKRDQKAHNKGAFAVSGKNST